MDYFVPLPGTKPTFSGSTLLLPQPSLGSLPQLAVDLYVHTLHLTLIGYLAIQDTIPAVSGLDSVEGEEVAGREGISFAVEVFQNADQKLTVVLPRSPIIRARKPHHLNSILNWVTAASFGEVLLLAGVDAATRGDDGIRESNPLRQFTFPSSTTTPLRSSLSQLPPFAPSSSSSLATSDDKPAVIPLFPHGGLTRRLLETFSTASSSSPPVSALLVYAAEGDNADLAFYFADALAELFGDEIEKDEEGKRKWKKPKSWDAGLMGEELGRDRVGEMFG